MPYPAHPGPWTGPPPLGPTARLLLPIVISLVVRVPVAVGPGAGRRRQIAGAVTVLIAAAGPLLLRAARRYPGPVVAAIAALTAVSALVEPVAAFGPPPLPLA